MVVRAVFLAKIPVILHTLKCLTAVSFPEQIIAEAMM